VIWEDERVHRERLLLLSEPSGLDGHIVVVRLAAGRPATLARIGQSHKGSEGRVHPRLARQLEVSSERRFEAEWRPAGLWDRIWCGDRWRFLGLVLALLVGLAAGAFALFDHAAKVGWRLAAVVAVVFALALFVKFRNDWQGLQP
jgi:hypothetical protein